jgi:hypothetical protein
MVNFSGTSILFRSLILLSKVALVVSVLLLVACGSGQINRLPLDNPTPVQPVNPPAPPSPIAASQVFSNQAETWSFKNAYGDLSWIQVSPQPDGSTVWHFTKNNCRAWWTPGACSAELYFNLSLIDGKWYSTGGHILFPFGAPWDSTPLDLVYQVFSDPGMPRPYLIIADSGTSVDTTFPDPNPGTRWKTSMYVEDGELISEQWEGPCVHEKWHFAVGKGLVKVEPLDLGSCVPADPNLVMTRI